MSISLGMRFKNVNKMYLFLQLLVISQLKIELGTISPPPPPSKYKGKKYHSKIKVNSLTNLFVL